MWFFTSVFFRGRVLGAGVTASPALRVQASFGKARTKNLELRRGVVHDLQRWRHPWVCARGYGHLETEKVSSLLEFIALIRPSQHTTKFVVSFKIFSILRSEFQNFEK